MLRGARRTRRARLKSQTSTESLGYMIVNHSTLTDAQKEQILSGNLMKLLKINAAATA